MNDIAARLGVSKSTAYQWVKHMPLDLDSERVRKRRQRYDLIFTNSDIRLVELFIRFIEANGRSRTDLRYRVSIHENADAEAAGRWWADSLGIGVECLQRPTLKRHQPQTTRLNIGDNYRGCLVVRVPKARELYLWIEGVVDGLSKSAGAPE